VGGLGSAVALGKGEPAVVGERCRCGGRRAARAHLAQRGPIDGHAVIVRRAWGAGRWSTRVPLGRSLPWPHSSISPACSHGICCSRGSNPPSLQP